LNEVEPANDLSSFYDTNDLSALPTATASDVPRPASIMPAIIASAAVLLTLALFVAVYLRRGR
jgi:hypothetical protein